jgi:putative ABC transport system permease protein
MFLRLLFESFRRQKRRKTIALLAITLGMAVATAMIAMSAGVGDKISRELRATGANLILTPVDDTLDVNLGGVELKPASEGRFIAESDLPKLKSIFWRNNITGFAPFLSDQVTFSKSQQTFKAELIGTYFSQTVRYGQDIFTTGVRSVNPWWRVTGNWPQDYAEWPKEGPADVLVGTKLAETRGLAVGDLIDHAGNKLRIGGILSTGGTEDQAVVAPLHIVQQILGQPNAVRRVMVNAITKPEDAFARRDPGTMSPAARDRWYCSPYANSIAFQIHEALPSVHVEQVRQAEQNQGRILARISGLMLLLTLAALLAAILAVYAAMTGTILERRNEVGLMKSMGASNMAVASLFLTEAGLLAVIGGLIGFLIGTIVAHRVGESVFRSSIDVHPVVLALVISTSFLVTVLGSAGAVRKAMQLDPAVVLRGDA